MTVVDLHPEDLLDKDSRGDLTEDEGVRLDAHLARCAACRAERVLRLDFAAELDGDDRPSALLGLVQGALKNADANAKADADAEASAKADADASEKAKADADADAELAKLGIAGLRRRRPARTAIVMLFAAALLAAGAAGATGLTARVWNNLRGTALDATHAPRPPELAPRAPSLAPARTADPPAIAEAPEPPITAQIQPESAPSPVRVALTHAPAPAPAPALAPSSAAALFDSANAARRAGDATTALSLYDGLERQFPNSREARSAKATGGRLLLDSGNAAGALARFDLYLASGAGELREEAMAGRATALERLGRDEDESRAWAALLATYPHTPYASHARARVGRSLPR